jgi:hypothetical protein
MRVISSKSFAAVLCLAASLLFPPSSGAQSTFGSVVGNVLDPSGAAVPNCVITVINIGTSSRRSTLTDGNGEYSVLNLDAGTYLITMEAPGFQVANYKDVVLQARQVVRLDGSLAVAALGGSVSVTASEEGVPAINTDVSNIAETKTSLELTDLPVAIGTRTAGSTSPMSTLTAQPGVQTDSGGNISVAGAKPAMLSMSIDGISSMGPRSSGPIPELFPAFYSIAEIRVSETNNSAEFAGISDITTISKSGSNAFHGGAFENVQNTALTARNTFSATVPTLNMNDYGLYGGGPISIPGLYSGKNRTFFFTSYEALDLHKQSVLVENVPSLAMRNGDLSVYANKIYQPGTGIPFANNQIPSSQISPIALNVLKYQFPLPNAGAPNAIVSNYIQNFPTPISSKQGDLRIDKTISQSQTTYARFTYKHRDVIGAPSGSVLIGPISSPEIDYGLTIAHNFVITPTLINELRAGYSGNHTRTTNGAVASVLANEIGITGLPQALPSGNTEPNFSITGFQTTGGNSSSHGINNTKQILDSVTWTHGKHTFKFGADYRHMSGYFSDSKLGTRLGAYTYNGAVTSLGLNGASSSAINPPYIGNPFAAFLLGIPDKTQVGTATQPDTDFYGHSLGFYVQDDWKVTPRLTLNYGFRYEYHPMFLDHLNNLANFVPNYTSTINGQVVNGAVIIPNAAAISILNPQFVQAIAPTPIFVASQLGINENLRYSNFKGDWAPRFGFAWRPLGNDKTVIRGGYGKFIEGPLGSIMSAFWSIAACYAGTYQQTIVNGAPSLVFPSPFPAQIAVPGSENFTQAAALNYRDPYVQQWNLTFERDLGYGTAVRVTYTGSHGSQLGYFADQNQLQPNTLGYAKAKASTPYPLWGTLPTEYNGARSNFNSFTVSATKRLSNGLQFQTSFVLAKNLTNGAGYNSTGYAGESGGTVTTGFDIGLDYGPDAYTRRSRSLSTFLYELPFGKGKRLMKNANGLVDGVLGGWELAGVLLYQSGPYLTVTNANADPAGTDFPILVGAGRVDSVPGVSAIPANRSLTNWVNAGAFAIPTNNIGRYGSEPVGAVQGPGTQVVSASLIKAIKFDERRKLQIGIQAANLFNHPNYAPPNLTLGTASFGTVTSLQSNEGAGPRTLQGTLRLSF